MKHQISCLILVGVCIFNQTFAQKLNRNVLRDSSAVYGSFSSLKNFLNTLPTSDSSLKARAKELIPVNWFPTIDATQLRKIMPIVPGTDVERYLKAKPFQLGNTSFSADGFYWPTDTSLTPSSFHRTELFQSVSVFSVPFEARITYGGAMMNPWESRVTYSFDFSEPDFIKGLSKRLGKFDPKVFMSGDIERAVREKISSTVDKQVNAWSSRFEDEWSGVMSRIGDVRALMETDIATLRAKIIPDSMAIEAKVLQEKIEWLSARSENLTKSEDSILHNAKTGLTKYKAVQEIFNEIVARRSGWDATGWKDAILSAELLQRTKVNEMLQSSGTVKQLARQKLNLGTVERFFMNIRKLNIGQSSLNQGTLVKQMLSNGLFSEFLNDKGKYLSLLQGAIQQFGTIPDIPFSGSMMPSQGSATAIRLGKGSVEGPHTHMFVGHYRMGQELTGFRNRMNQLMQKSTVIGVSKAVSIGSKGRLEVDLSKSMMEMSFLRSPLDSFGNGQSFIKGMTQGDMFSSMSFNVDYTNQIESWNLEHRLYVRHAGNKYINPGNPFLPSGSTEIGLYARKTGFKGKLIGSLRATGRHYAFQGNEGEKYRNINVVADLRWRFRRGQFLNARYQPSSFKSMGADGRIINRMSRMALDGQVVQRIAGLQYRSYVSIAYAKNEYGSAVVQAPLMTESFMLNMNQQLILKQLTPFINLTVNRVNNRTGMVYFNNSLMVDAGASFTMAKLISLSSAILFNTVNNWYTQVGVRQSVSGNLKSFQWFANIDLRKNLSVSTPLYMQNFRIDWGMRYTLNSHK